MVAGIAAEALGPDRVTAVAIPSRYTDPRSTAGARELSQALGIEFEVVDLERLHLAAEATLGHLGMPALVQPTHLLAASLLFGFQFLIWMGYRHSRDADTSSPGDARPLPA